MARLNGYALPFMLARPRRFRFAAALALVLACPPFAFSQSAPSGGGSAGAGSAPSSVKGGITKSAAANSSPSNLDAPTDRPKETHHRTIPTTPIEIAEALGLPFMLVFFVMSVIAVWFGIERLLVLRKGRVIPRPFVTRFLQNLEQGNLEPEQALALCEENGSPLALVFAHGIRKWGRPSVEVEQAIIDGGERQVSQLRRHLRALNAVATIAPLLGLLGTVIGMIQCFNEIAGSQAMGKSDQLAGGIAIALLSTAVGLFIAISSLTLYMYLAGRADALVVEMDLLAQNVVHLVSAEAIAEGAQTAGKGRGRRPPNPTAESKERKAV